ncbi:3-phosphoshikimate 1-carboxyvinyltransferase [Candidatus Photodesmus blepharus]|uniref:3-phosphoshikimate 1-carboxyvinyltransferase n=1 Tax=Candidatus Photodesmus blepharonis TaxID=1179155 RepID=A0A084CPM7_9GAMM|nr:3-phosphoshikimate 1-carboxyvinyltransferase [Candidatus Photodesmus blepharus]KEY91756.1 3-phosphoshikimate 1-carboxyvinyltransferase [Candidatus Photodesmus blepharus]
MKNLTLQSITKVNGEITLPGSKSISSRVLLIAALSEGTTRLINLLDSNDITYMLNALSKLGIKYQFSKDKKTCEVKGLGKPFQTFKKSELFLGNSGIAIRLLTAVLCLSEGEYILTGESRMKERPIGHLVQALLEAGARIEYLENSHFPPLKIVGTSLKKNFFLLNSSISSQFLSALLISAPLLQSHTTIKIKCKLVSKTYIDTTLHVMKHFGIKIINNNYKEFLIPKGQYYVTPGDFMAEGDASSASYFLAAGAIKGGEIKVKGVDKNSIQGDIQFANVLEKMGAKIEWGENYIISRVGPLQGIDIDCNHIPDSAMTLAITALFAKGKTKVRNIYNWRVKETDRLSAMTKELRKLGAKIEEGRDYITITPVNQLKHATINTYNDHRMAMCFSLVALSDAGVTINGFQCISKTFPNYFDNLAKLSK